MWAAVQRTKTLKYVGNISTNSISRHVGNRTANQHFNFCREEFIKTTLQNLS